MIGGLLGNPIGADGVIDPRRMAMMGLFQNIGNIIAGGQATANPGQMFMQAQMYNQNADTRQAENELRRMQIEQARQKMETDAQRRRMINQAMGGGAPTEIMGPAMPGQAGQTQVMSGYNAADIEGTGQVDMEALGRILAMDDPAAFMTYDLQRQTANRPDIKSVQEGTEKVTYQINPDGSRTELGRGPMWEPDTPDITMPWGMDPENQQKLRKEFAALPEVKQWGTVQTGYETLRKLAERGSPMDQVAAMFAFLKTLDPDSVVRDSETGMLTSAGSLTNKIGAYMENLRKGGTVGTEVLAGMRETADTIYQTQYDRYNSIRDEWQRKAQAYGTQDPSLIIGQAPIAPTPVDQGAGPTGDAAGLALDQPRLTPNPPMETPPMDGSPSAVPLHLWGTREDPWAMHRGPIDKERAKKERERLRKEEEAERRRRTGRTGQSSRGQGNSGRAEGRPTSGRAAYGRE